MTGSTKAEPCEPLKCCSPRVSCDLDLNYVKERVKKTNKSKGYVKQIIQWTKKNPNKSDSCSQRFCDSTLHLNTQIFFRVAF